jgi:DNA-binding NarL/FixJ family response regulator
MGLGGPLAMAIRIIVCDDHPVFRAGLVAALASEPDIDVVGEVGSLAGMRRRLTGTGADLVLLDVELPDGDAVDAVAEVAADCAVVMISAHDHADLVRRALRDGALGYIRKDAEPSEVLRLVRRAAEGNTALSADGALRLAESLRRRRDRTTVEQRWRH